MHHETDTGGQHGLNPGRDGQCGGEVRNASGHAPARRPGPAHHPAWILGRSSSADHLGGGVPASPEVADSRGSGRLLAKRRCATNSPVVFGEQQDVTTFAESRLTGLGKVRSKQHLVRSTAILVCGRAQHSSAQWVARTWCNATGSVALALSAGFTGWSRNGVRVERLVEAEECCRRGL